MIGRCAKRHVEAVLIGASGTMYVGTNEVRNPQPTCPRVPGEGYEKCKTICDQISHAEVEAIRKAGPDAKGGTMVIGYYYACGPCQLAMHDAGIAAVKFVGPEFP